MTGTLVQQGMLVLSGHGRGMRYCLPGKKMPDLFGEIDVNSEHYQEKSEHKEINSEHNDSSSKHYAHLLSLAESIRNKQRTSPEQVKSSLCNCVPMSFYHSEH